MKKQFLVTILVNHEDLHNYSNIDNLYDVVPYYTKHSGDEFFDYLLNTHSTVFGVNVDDILSKKRNRSFVEPRQSIMFFMRKFTSLSSIKIGELLSKDHCTVLHGVKNVYSLIDPDFGDKVFTNKFQKVKKLVDNYEKAIF